MKRILLTCVLLITSVAHAQIAKVIPPHTGFITDAAHVLDSATTTKLHSIAATTQTNLGGDIAVVTLPSIGDFPPNEVAMTIGRTWGVGGKGPAGTPQRNLGVVVLLVPRTNQHKGECFVAPGLGAEGFITDYRSAELCRNHLDELKAGSYNTALLGITTAVASLMELHVHPPPPPVPVDHTGAILWALAIVGLVTAFGTLVFRRQERARLVREEMAKVQRRREQAERAEERARYNAAQAARLAAEAEAERVRWTALTPDQQVAELAERERRRVEAVAAAGIAAEAARKRRKRDDEEAARRTSSSYDYGSSSSSSSSSYDYGSSSSSSSDSFGGGGGFDGGGGGSSF
jgi:uncharacterized membrane protein YgcG